jgi:hypothetical protein
VREQRGGMRPIECPKQVIQSPVCLRYHTQCVRVPVVSSRAPAR